MIKKKRYWSNNELFVDQILSSLINTVKHYLLYTKTVYTSQMLNIPISFA